MDDETKEYVHHIHCSMYIIFWISVTVYPISHVTIADLGGNRQTAWTMQMIKKRDK